MPIRFALPVRLLPDDLRAQMHAQLAALERAGVPPAQAVGLLDLPGEWKAAATRTSRALARGQSLADAGAAAGLFTPLETSVLRAAIHAGSFCPSAMIKTSDGPAIESMPTVPNTWRFAVAT